MKTIQKNQILLLLFALLVSFSSCESEDPIEELEQELITDVTLIFTEVNDEGTAIGTPFEVKASDPQGIELGTNPVVETINVEAGKRYLLEITLFNSIENEDITEEIEEEDDEHQFYFLGSAFVGSSLMTYTYDDADDDGNPIGLRCFVQVAENSSVNNANFNLVLRHDLDKSFPGANSPNFQNYVQAGGETDLDVTFPVVLN
jgi:hypothetical protein